MNEDDVNKEVEAVDGSIPVDTSDVTNYDLNDLSIEDDGCCCGDCI